MQLAVRDVDEAWDIAAQIEQRVHLHGGFGGPEMGPIEHRHAQIDGRGIQRIDAVGQIHVQAIDVCLSDQPLGEPVSKLIW
jgi:hypothetical protein